MGSIDRTHKKVHNFIRDHNLFYPGEKVIVAVSGGADSLCLLYILNSLKSLLNINLHIAHLNHGIRGREAEKDARFVARLAGKLGIPLTSKYEDVAAYKKRMRLSLEEAAREKRYEFFAGVAGEENADCVAVAHTSNDNVETILLHILRGSGISGLRGLMPRSVMQFGQDKLRLNVVRPLLEMSRTEVEEYCRESKIKPRFDSTNVSMTFARNRIRLELLPQLKSYNPRIEDALLRLASIANDETAFLEEQVSQLWSEIAEEYEDAVALDIKMIIHLHPIVQRQLLRWAVKYLWGTTRDIEAFHIEDMIKFISKPAGKTLCLPQGLRLHTEYNKLILSRDQAEICPFPPMETYSLAIPGKTEIPGWLIETIVLKKEPGVFEGNFIATLDHDKTGDNLIVRGRCRGDVFQPLGMQQTKSLQEFMIDAKIPRHWRDNIPLVCNNSNLIWVVGWRIDDRFKVTDSTEKVLRLEFKRIA